jgi:DNA-binding MarR family transcriptional regulator
MPERLSDAGFAAWSAFLGSYAIVRDHLERELEEARGMPLSWYEVLVRLSEAPDGAIRMQQLARGVFLSKSGLTQVATRMEAAGLITREPCPSDRRGINAVITNQGRRAARRAAVIHLAGIQSHFGRHLDDAELEAVAAAMGKVFSAEAPRGATLPGSQRARPRRQLDRGRRQAHPEAGSALAGLAGDDAAAVLPRDPPGDRQP